MEELYPKASSKHIALAVVTLLVAACGEVAAGDADRLGGEITAELKATTLPWSFTTSPYASHGITAPAAGVNVFPFHVASTDKTSSQLTRLSFVYMGTAPLWTISNVQLVYYPAGLKRPGTVVATASGASWAPGTNGTLELVLSSPVAVSGNFSGDFALFVDVGGEIPYFFQMRLQTATISVAGVEKLVDGTMTCDLPLNGDQFNVATPGFLPWTFTTAPYTSVNVTAPAAGVRVMPIQIASTDATPAYLTRLSFGLMGMTPASAISNAQLLYYPNGLNNPGTVVATNGGAAWAPNTSIGSLELTLASPMLVQNGFRGLFALVVDVGSSAGTFFQVRLQTATVSVGGLEKYVDGWMTCDLPLNAGQFNVQ